jgi:hypothetical protein
VACAASRRGERPGALETLNGFTTGNAQGLAAGKDGLKNITTLLADDLAGRIAQELLRATIPGSDIQPLIDRESGVGSVINHIVSVNHWENPNRYCP